MEKEIRFVGRLKGEVVFDKKAKTGIDAGDLDWWGWDMINKGFYDSYTIYVNGDVYSECEN